MTPDEYRKWILTQTDSRYEIIETGDTVFLETEYASASVRFYEQNIVELTITLNSSEEIMFYLHFQLGDEEHAVDLFHQMRSTLLSLKEKTKYKVLLTCSSALTTSYFAQELNKAAEMMKLDYEFSAVSFSHIFEKGFDYDMILLAPQIHYQYEKTVPIFRNQIVLKIPAAIFGQYRTGELISLIMQERQKPEKKEKSEKPALRSPFENERRILTMGLINHRGLYRFPYTIYDHGKPTLDKEVVKPTFNSSDIFDLMDYIVARHHNIDAISIALPGVAFQGHLWLPDQGFLNENLGQILSSKYGIPVMVINDTNAIVLGYHALNEDTDNIVFYFQPTGMPDAGAGILIGGRLHTGRKNASGEIQGLTHYLYPDGESLIRTPEGALKMITAGLLAYISVLAPEKIILYSVLTPDMDAIRRELEKYIDPEYIPELIHVEMLKTYMMPGALIYALDVFERRKDWADSFTGIKK